MDEFRIERDSLGEVRVPSDKHFGAATQRALENFPVSGIALPRRFIRALGRVKLAAAKVNKQLNAIEGRMASAIAEAAQEVTDGKWDAEFVVDVFQTGSGTSTNMNANELIASRANEILGGSKGDRLPVRPTDDVNMSQSSNDVFPSAIHLAVLEAADEDLLPSLSGLAAGLEKKAGEFAGVLKTGRTHLQDAVVMTLGQEFSGYAAQLRHGISRLETAKHGLLELPIGGTALGTGINAPPDFGARMCCELGRITGAPFREAANKFEAIGSRDALVYFSGTLKALAVSLFKIASDIRLLASGPRTGIGEIHLPNLQPGSSIMPGKINPVAPEMMIQVCAQIIGNDCAVTLGGMSGNLELNTMMPLIARNVLESSSLLSSACRIFDERCVSSGPPIEGEPENSEGIRVNLARCRELLEKSFMGVTALVPKLGYEKSAEIARKAWKTGKTIREIVLAEKLMEPLELEKLLNPSSQAGTGKEK